MASIAEDRRVTSPSGERFFVRSALVMTLLIIAGFSVQWLTGRSTFHAPLGVHLHAIVFMSWVALYLLQNIFVASDRMTFHRRLGWIGVFWLIPMVVMGCYATVTMVRNGQVPFVFRPLHFLVFDTVTVAAFAALTVAAVVLRRKTEWHRRLHFCGMSLLLMPAIGRLLPMPLLIPFTWEAAFVASLLFPVAGVVADLRKTGSVHPGWRWGIGAMLVTFVVIEGVTYSSIGSSIYRTVTATYPGQQVPPMAFGTPPIS